MKFLLLMIIATTTQLFNGVIPERSGIQVINDNFGGGTIMLVSKMGC